MSPAEWEVWLGYSNRVEIVRIVGIVSVAVDAVFVVVVVLKSSIC